MSEKDNWKKLEDSLTIALNVVYIDSERYFTDIEKYIRPKFKKKIPLKILNKVGWVIW